MCSLCWPAVPPAAGSSAWRRTTAGTPRRGSLIEVRQRPAAHTPRAAGHVSTERKEADSRRATTALPTSGRRQPGLRHCLPNRVVGANTNTRWAPPAPTGRRPAPLVADRVFGSRRKGRRGFDHGLPRQLTDQWVATSEGWRWRLLQGGLRGSSPWLRRERCPAGRRTLHLARCLLSPMGTLPQ